MSRDDGCRDRKETCCCPPWYGRTQPRAANEPPRHSNVMTRTSGFVAKVAAAAAAFMFPTFSGGEQVAVRHTEGLVHGFLALRTLDGSPIADGDLLQTARGTRVTSRLVFHFKDGSLHDETAVYS